MENHQKILSRLEGRGFRDSGMERGKVDRRVTWRGWVLRKVMILLEQFDKLIEMEQIFIFLF